MRILTIKDFCYISDGNYSSKYPRSDEFVSVGIPFIRANNLVNGTVVADDMYYISPDKHAELRKGHLQEGDVLITTRGNIGQTAIVPEKFHDANINAQIVLLRVDRNIAIPQYLAYALHSESVEDQIRRSTTGTALKQLPVGKLENIKVKIHSYSEQQRIVTVMHQVDELIYARRKQLAKLDQFVKSRFIELFGDPIDNPKGLPVKTLKGLSTLITNGNTPKGGSENYVDEGILFLRSQNVWRNRIELDDVAYIDEATHRSLKKSSLKHKDILITKTGRINTENSSLGRAALYLGDDDSANINGHVYLVRLDGSVVPEYVVTILTSEAYRKYIRKVCVGGIDKRQINLDQVEDFPIILPPVELQKQFAAFVEQTDKSKLAIQQSLDKLEMLKKSLMQEYFG